MKDPLTMPLAPFIESGTAPRKRRRGRQPKPPTPGQLRMLCNLATGADWLEGFTGQSSRGGASAVVWPSLERRGWVVFVRAEPAPRGHWPQRWYLTGAGLDVLREAGRADAVSAALLRDRVREKVVADE